MSDQAHKTRRSIVRGCGSYLPERIVANRDLEEIVETSDPWIVQRTGIRERRIAGPEETTSFLGLKAAQAALADAGLEGNDIDLIVCATSTPDFTFPATATQIQMGIGMEHGAAFDIQAVCTGFVYGVSTADKFLQSGSHKRALVIGAETFSRIIDWTDRGTCVLFGDGAGAIVLEASDDEEPGPRGRGVLTTKLRSDGRHREKLYVDGGPGSTKTTGHLRMQGQDVFKFAVSKVIDVVTDAFEEAGVGPDDLDWFVPHQANRRIIEASADKLGIAREKVVITVDRHGNTSAASIPLALDAAKRDGRLKEGDLVMLEAIGGGFTWGSALVRW
ncbi:beta-ketoacyl-ACP synthase III [Enterovirga rhinocerotis]|uniref:Beta-ketoacyl-[acyl-carrier-protein] synthase III n=1 Tax=Enterovirga rhinocerotis TaxID=1339210 RepID=A0A4R7C809_9HYPH|nr:beta-ketoacyl-ACP synthase III [Enterovirga rhinocerotis]TDR94112.1 3-oxoacyl-[acyl-carrier-protein] synthase-3 [Enterovirga rhinocerotis]